MPVKNVKQAMREYRSGDLHSGKGGPVVQSKKQAVAIGLSAERRAGHGKSGASGKKR